METEITKARKMGSSIITTIPIRIVRKLGIKPKDMIRITIEKVIIK